MKKSLIVAGASAVAVATMPIVGVFAAGPTSFTDHLSVLVEPGCTIETSAAQTAGSYFDRTLGETIPAGTYKILDVAGDTTDQGATLTVTCNGADATKNWQVTITPPASGNLTAQTTEDVIAPGVATSGNVSGWAIKSNAAGGTFNSDPWAGDYTTAAPASATTFLKGTLVNGNSGTFKPTYRVYVAPDLDAATYSGDVTYSVQLVSASQG